MLPRMLADKQSSGDLTFHQIFLTIWISVTKEARKSCTITDQNHCLFVFFFFDHKGTTLLLRDADNATLYCS